MAASSDSPKPPTGTEPAAAAPRGYGWQAKVALAVVAACAALALFWPRGEGSFDAPGGFLMDGAGRPAPLGSRLAPVTVLHFWATWCPPCIVEIPALQRLAAEFGGDMDFAIVMVAVEDEVEKVETFMGATQSSVLYDHSWEVAHRYGTRKLPETYLVVRGRVVEKFEGTTDWDDPGIRDKVRAALTG